MQCSRTSSNSKKKKIKNLHPPFRHDSDRSMYVHARFPVILYIIIYNALFGLRSRDDTVLYLGKCSIIMRYYIITTTRCRSSQAGKRQCTRARFFRRHRRPCRQNTIATLCSHTHLCGATKKKKEQCTIM